MSSNVEMELTKTPFTKEDRMESKTDPTGKIIQIDEGLVQSQISSMVKKTVEETLNPCWMLRQIVSSRLKNMSVLPAARLRHIMGTKWSTKKYLNMDLLKEIQEDNAKCKHTLLC